MRDQALIEWILRRRRLVLGLSLVVVAAGGLAAAGLPIRADFSALLPPSTPSVRHLEAIQKRVRAFGTAFILVESGDPVLRARASQEIRREVERLDPSLVARVSGDDGPLRRFVWTHRHLFAGVEDLTRAKGALAARIEREKLRANPLYIDLDEPAPASDPGLPDSTVSSRTRDQIKRGDPVGLDDLRRRLDEAEARGKSPAPFVSKDGRLQLLIVQASFPASEIPRTRALADQLERILDGARRRHPDIRVGLTGDVATTLSEQRSILVGMLRAAAVTVALCTLLLALAYRSAPGIAAVLWALAAGTLATLAVARLFIGHLNIATAFLSAIVVGNGINPGLILLSRYRDERRQGDPARALPRAMAGAARGTLTASAAAAVAYLSLAVTEFRGFRHFGLIGGVGMVLCWVAAFTVLPAALAELEARGRIRFLPARARSRRLTALVPGGAGLAAALGLIATGAAAFGAYRYLAGDPLEKDWRRLRSDSAEILAQRAWNDRISSDFEQGFNRNLSGRFAIVVPRREEVAPLVEALRAHDRGQPASRALLSEVRSLDDLLPDRQAEKLALYAELRRMIDDDLAGELEGEDRAEILRLRPPDDLHAIGDRDVPVELAWPFIERDGTVGRIVLAAKSDRFDGWNVDDLVEFSRGVTAIPRPEGTLLGGQAFVFADMLRTMERDGPRAVALSLIGSALTVIVLLGAGRHGAATILCALAGSAGMIAIAGGLGVKINFLDFIALPITIGIGADYAANIAARERDAAAGDRAPALLAAGGAVLLCSLTTIIGYGSLFGSDNAGIRSFGLAAIIGEATCLLAALLLCPALLASRRGRD